MSAFLIEDLDASVAPVGDEQPALRVHGEGVRRAELAILVAPGTKAHDEGPVRREFGNTSDRVWSRLVLELGAVCLGDEDAAVRRHEHVIGFGEVRGRVTGLTWGA